ncbi:uncharacterized protein LOC142487228 isoform X2 [Ascaphus truei]|uniref:uncharacterized protein LOC142487228 isoform X2 n=1 Tax=Ascaphus truei TaxID=8439 RepID=UPI003F5AC2D1
MNMEILAAAQHRTSFWCIICNVPFRSAAHLESHFMGAKHKKVEATHRNHGDDVHRSEVYSGNTLQELFNTCKATEPALGLEYIYECHPNESGNFIYRCTICCCETSLVYMFTHVLGTKHRTAYLRKHHPEKSGGEKKNVKEICLDIERMYGRKSINVIEGTSLPRSFDDDVHRSEVYSGNTLQELFNTYKATEPALGLEYIYECHPDENGNFIYRCTICCWETRLVDMFTHVLGTKHRIAYLRKHHPEKSGADKKYVKEICSDIERMFGRKSINVIEGTSLPRSFADELAPRPPINYRPDNKLQNMDLENFVDISGKQSAPRCDITFRELKAAHEAKLSETHTSWAPVQSSSGRQDNDRDLEVLSMECSECDPDEFMCNSELFEFLDSFKIINDTDVSFILKVTESFSNALVRYKKNSAEKKALPNAAGSNAPHSNINQPSIPSAHGFNRYPEPATNYTPNQLFPSVSQFNPRGPITEPRFPLSIGSASNIPQGQWPNRTLPPYTAVPSPCFVPFPQGMPPPAMPPDVSRCFPRGFPLAKDEANFFASNKEHGGSRGDDYIEQYSCYKPSLQRNSRFKLDKIFD